MSAEDDDESFDALFRALPAPEPSAGLDARIAAAFRAEVRRAGGQAHGQGRPQAIRAESNISDRDMPLRRMLWQRMPSRWFARGAAAAALFGGAALLWPGEQAERGDPAQMVARGDPGAQPGARIGLSAVARRPGEAGERLRARGRYPAGTTLVFRVWSAAGAEIVLLREGEEIYRGRVGAGETVLPVGYELEAGEGAAGFEVREVGGSGGVVGAAAADRIEIGEVLP